MSDFYEESFIEPESAFTLKGSKAEVQIQFSVEAMERATSELMNQHIENNFIPKLQRACDNFLQLKGYTSFETLIKDTVKEELLKRYPDVVENKVNEIAEYIKKIKVEDSRDYKWTGQTISDCARNKVKEYIEKELVQEVKVTKEWLETFSRNYFANNLFRAMGMMDKMIPEAIQHDKKEVF